MGDEGALRSGLRALGLQLTDPQVRQLSDYLALLAKWNRVYNLTALRDPSQMLTHHLLDSLAVVPSLMARLAQPPAEQGVRLLDVGSGGGLPGVVLAICLPELLVDCVDAVGKKAAFVQQCAVDLGLKNLRGLHARVEALTGAYEVVASRAFASLPDFVRLTQHLLAPGGCWMAMKGRDPREELAGLPADVALFHVEPLRVPGLDAERCIVWLGRP